MEKSVHYFKMCLHLKVRGEVKRKYLRICLQLDPKVEEWIRLFRVSLGDEEETRAKERETRRNASTEGAGRA